VWKEMYILASIIYMLGYFFDVLDGYYARLYKMVSVYGDILDHGKDTLVTISMIIVIIFHSKIPTYVKVIYLISISVLGILTIIYSGCQETYYHKGHNRGKGHDAMAILKNLCTIDAENKLHWLRWGGTGTFAVFIMILFASLHVIAKK